VRIDTIPEGALLMYDNNQQSALGVKNCKVNIYQKLWFLPDFGVYEAKMGFRGCFWERLNSTLLWCHI
jgi:hypothetical protein